MLKFDEQRQIESVNGALALRSKIESIVDDICHDGYDSLYFLGIGGTYASALQVVTLIEGQSDMPAYAIHAAEYLTSGYRRIGKNSIVVLSSVSGTTAEMVQAVKKVQDTGARVIGFIDTEGTPLAKTCDFVISYPANEQLKFFMVAHRFLFNHDDFAEYHRYYAEMDQYLAQGLVDVEKAADDFGRMFAEAHKDDEMHYFIGAGSQWGSTYSYAMCYWEEQHWLRSKSIHAGEFFHGTFEVIERGVPVTVFIGEDAQRPLCLRVAEFLPRVTDRYTLIDAKDYMLKGISPEFRGSLSHLVLHAVTQRIDAHMECLNCHPMEIRRYYNSLKY